MKHKENSQATDILNHLQKQGKITSVECIELWLHKGKFGYYEFAKRPHN